MNVSLQIHRAAIGVFNNYHIFRSCQLFISSSLSLLMDIMLLLLILLSSDIEVNPDLPRNLTSNVGHINVGSLNVEDKFDEITTICP